MISKFKALPKGVQRAIIVASLIVPFIAGRIMDKYDWVGVGLVICTPIYWVLIFAGIWIYEGFKTDK
jgi:fucose permease